MSVLLRATHDAKRVMDLHDSLRSHVATLAVVEPDPSEVAADMVIRDFISSALAILDMPDAALAGDRGDLMLAAATVRARLAKVKLS